MTDFYTSAIQYGNQILLRGVRDGVRVQERVPFEPSLWVKSNKPTEWRTMHGEHLERIRFDSINDAKDFAGQYRGMDDHLLYGMTQFQYQFLTENYPGEIVPDLSLVSVQTIDIETTVEHGFPSVTNPIEEILLITVQDRHSKKKITWGQFDFDVAKIKHIDLSVEYTYIKCNGEKDLLQRFLAWWSQEAPDVVTGWNIQKFDIPYLVARIGRVLGEEKAKLLAPWRRVRGYEIEEKGRTYPVFDLAGLAQLDFMDLYKKFTYQGRESYKLDYIATVELGVGKLPNPYDSFKEFYEKDWHNFVEYNVVDVERVDGLEDHLRLILLALTVAWSAKCNFTDIFSPVRTWDCLLHNHMWDLGMIVPPGKEPEAARQIEGAYVKKIENVAHDWIVSFDATSLYPSLIRQYNLSPEKMIVGETFDTNVDKLLAREVDLAALKENDWAMTANGYCYSRDGQGIFAEITTRVFQERVRNKDLMLQAKKDYEATRDVKYKGDAARYKVIQEAQKILLNSLYGAMANRYFRYYDDRMAEGITLSGQLVLRTVMNAVNVFLNDLLGTKGIDYAFYGDTDSVYMTLGKMVEKFFPGKSKEKTVDMLNKICKEKLTQVINAACEDLADYTNAFERTISFKREAIADRGIWSKPKKYVLNVYDNEGVRIKDPKDRVKVTGLEIVRSSTPTFAKDMLKEAVRLALTGTQADVQAYIAKAEGEFRELPVEEIAFPRGTSDLENYTSGASIYKKGCPIHVRGALLYNHFIKEKGLTGKYELIRSGDKIKFLHLRMPNPIRENVIAFTGGLPKELDLSRYVDYDTMWEKAFVAPMQSILDALKWTVAHVATLDDLFA